MALISFIIPMYLLDNGFSYSLITLVSGIAAIPWLIKFIWGGIVDYFIKYGRKKFVIIGSIIAVFCLISLSLFNPKNGLIPFAILLCFSHMGILFMDVSADAWAIEISIKNERGKINGSMMAGTLVGLSLGGTFFAIISTNIGYNYVFIIAGLLVFLLAIFPFFVKELIKIKKYENISPVLISEFKKKTTILIAIFGLVLVINRGLHAIFPLFEKTVLNLDIIQISLLGNIGVISSISGALVGGYLSDSWGRKRVIYVLIIICMIFSASLIFVERWEHLILYMPITFSYFAFIIIFMAMVMDITNPRIGATQFSIFTSISNLGEWLGVTISGTLVTMLGFSRVFLYSAWVLGPALILLYFIKIKTPLKKTNQVIQ